MGRPKLPWSLEHSPTLTLQHVRTNRGRLFKRRKARATDPIRTKLARRSNSSLQRPGPNRGPEPRTPILLSVQRTNTNLRERSPPGRVLLFGEFRIQLDQFRFVGVGVGIERRAKPGWESRFLQDSRRAAAMGLYATRYSATCGTAQDVSGSYWISATNIRV